MTKKSNTNQLTLCALFVALISIGAFLKVPVPVVPFTLQYLFTMLAGLLLGPTWGMVSVLAYLVLGLMGLPIFAAGGGPAYLFQPSFGYLIGFALGAWVTGKIAYGQIAPTFGHLLGANLVGLGVVYLVGMAYYYAISNFYLGTPIGLWPLFLYCFLLAVPGDLVLCVVGAALGRRLIPLLGAGTREANVA